MSAAAAWRIGSVAYLNARPLIYGIEDRVNLCVPARLADLLARGQFDVGLVPIAEVLRADRYDVLDGIGIGARGPVRSVFLAHREPIETLQRVAVDPASRTSVWLLRVLLQVGYGIRPEFYPRPHRAELGEHTAMMIIGDEAIWYATHHPAEPVFDLGEAWVELTGLPFVFAAWAFPRAAAPGRLVELLRAAKANGLAHLEQIVQDSPEATPEFLREYFTRHVWYELGDREKQGIRRFQRYLKELGLVDHGDELRYIS